MSGLLPHEKRFLQFLAGHLALGVAAAAGLTGLLLYFDLFGLRSLAVTQPEGWLGIALIFIGLAITFGSVAMGIGVMSQARHEGDGGDEEE